MAINSDPLVRASASPLKPCVSVLLRARQWRSIAPSPWCPQNGDYCGAPSQSGASNEPPTLIHF